jgi:superfamily II DNA or RNA helicase
MGFIRGDAQVYQPLAEQAKAPLHGLHPHAAAQTGPSSSLMNTILYDYQVQGVERLAEWFQDANATREALISLTMGMGKTRTAASCI